MSFLATGGMLSSPTTATAYSVPAIGTAQTAGLTLTNPTAAAVGAQQYSPMLQLTGNGWKTTATAGSQAVDAATQLRPVQGAANPSARMDFMSRINGGAWSTLMTLSSGGGLILGATAVGVDSDPGVGNMTVGGGIAYFGPFANNCRVQGNGATVSVSANLTTSSAFVDLQSNMATNTAGGTVARARVWAFAGTQTVGRIFSVGDGSSFTEKWAINFDGKIVNSVAANETATATAAGVQAVPATVRGYLSFIDSGGTTRKIPYFDT